MCSRKAAAALLPQVNLIVVGLCACICVVVGAVVLETPEVAAPALWLPGVLLCAAAAALALAHLALAAPHAHRHARRRTLLAYALCTLLAVVVEVGAAGGAAWWGASWLAEGGHLAGEGSLAWLETRAPALCRWLRLPLSLVAPHVVEGMREEEPGLRAAMVAVWTATALVPALQLLAAVLALVARPRPPRDTHSDRRTNSVVYESGDTPYCAAPSAPFKAPLDHIAAWQ